MNRNSHFRAMANEISVQTCISVGESIKSFSALLKKASAGELDQKPKFPNYRKPGFQLIAFPKRALKLVNGRIRLPLGLQVKAWFGLKEFFLPMPSNLEFVQIPTARLKERIKQLCEIYGIQFSETEESYTSKASFVDSDYLPKYREKPEGWEQSGKRVKRGLYRTKNKIGRAHV